VHLDTLLLILLSALAGGVIPTMAWLRTARRLRHLEMTLLAQTTDADQYAELRALLEHVAQQTEQLADAQAQLARRVAERPPEALPPGRPDASRPITPH
jgi:enoyl-CoA hydratase/carnithine racemase